MFSSLIFNKNNLLTLNTSLEIKILDKSSKTNVLNALKIMIKNVQTDSKQLTYHSHSTTLRQSTVVPWVPFDAISMFLANRYVRYKCRKKYHEITYITNIPSFTLNSFWHTRE